MALANIQDIETALNGIHPIGKNPADIKNSIIFNIIVEEDRFIHADTHPRGFAESTKNNFKWHPLQQGTRSKQNNIIHKEEVGKSQGRRDFDTSDESIHPSIINQKIEPFNYKNEKQGG